MYYNSITFTVDNENFLEKGRVNADVRLRMRVGGKRLTFNKRYSGPINSIENFLRLPINVEKFGNDRKLIDGIRKVDCQYPQNEKGRDLERYTREFMDSILPNNSF